MSTHVAAAVLAFDPNILPGRSLFYLAVAGLSLILALRLMRRALAPIGALVQAATAALLVAVAIGAALVLVTAAVVSAG